MNKMCFFCYHAGNSQRIGLGWVSGFFFFCCFFLKKKKRFPSGKLGNGGRMNRVGTTIGNGGKEQQRIITTTTTTTTKREKRTTTTRSVSVELFS